MDADDDTLDLLDWNVDESDNDVDVGTKLVRMAHKYLESIVFFQEQDRQVLSKFVDLIEIWQKLQAQKQRARVSNLVRVNPQRKRALERWAAAIPDSDDGEKKRRRQQTTLNEQAQESIEDIENSNADAVSAHGSEEADANEVESEAVIPLKQKRFRSCGSKAWRSSKKLLTSPSKLLMTDTDARAVHRRALGITEEDFQAILKLLHPVIRKSHTRFRNGTPSSRQLDITLQYLAAGGTYLALEAQTGFSHSFMVYCIPKVCQAIWDSMKHLYMKFPDSPERWEAIANDFGKKWQFPLCLGAMNAKHVCYTCTSKPHVEPAIANCRKLRDMRSVVLLSLADAHSKFIYINVSDAQSRPNENVEDSGNAGILNGTQLQSLLDNGMENLPPEQLVDGGRLLPYVVVADSSFALQKHLMKPFLKVTPNTQLYNERLECARQAADRAFAIMAARFRVFEKPIKLRNSANVELLVKACCTLHNFLMERSVEYASDISLSSVGGTGDSASTHAQAFVDYQEQLVYENRAAETIRHNFVDYFNSI